MSRDEGTHANVKKFNDASVPEKVGPKGGEGGTAWDDGSDHDGMTHISVSTTGAGISFVQFSYVKDGQTKDSACHGRYYKGSTITEIVINHPDEYLLSVEGWYDSDNTLKGIQFKTNQKTSDYIGYKFYGGSRTAFTLQVQNKRIIGFFGCASNHLNSIGAYFSPSSWDDGEHAKVKKVQLTYDDVIYSIKVTYDGTALQSQCHGSVGPKSVEFTLESDEYITALSGYCKTLNSQDIISALTFTTNKRTFETYGNKTDYEIYAPEVTGKQIAGFFGASSKYLNSIDVHYAPAPSESGPEKVGPEGGEGGVAWDDGSDHDGLTKIYVGFGEYGIHSVKFDYVKGAFHGVRGRESTTEFGINHPEEYLLSVEGWYNSTNIIQGIRFITNKKTSAYIGYESNGTGREFTLQVQDKKIIGFFGCSSDYLNSIGAYFVPSGSGPEKVGPKGGQGGTAWEDGSNHDDVKEITAGFGGAGIHYVQFNYVKGGQTEHGALHGENGKVSKITKFGIDHTKEEYLVSVEGWYDSSNFIQGIQFRTNKKLSEYIGYESDGTGKEFTLQVQDKKIIGFFGFASTYVNSIGAYFVPSPSPTTKKLKAVGGETGVVWDDGPHDDVKKVYVGLGYGGVVAVKFEYTNGSQEHGRPTKLGYEEFELESEEYIASMEGTYDRIYGSDSSIVTMLKFETNNKTTDNKKTHGPFGIESGTHFVFSDQKWKIAGFHGRASSNITESDSIHAIGVYLAPVATTPLTPAAPTS